MTNKHGLHLALVLLTATGISACKKATTTPQGATVASADVANTTRPIQLAKDAPLLSAAEVMSMLTASIQDLYVSSGYRQPSDLIGAAKAAGGNAAKASALLMNEQIEVAMAAPAYNRNGITQSGFLNFRQSGNSQGGSMRGREPVEGNYVGLHSQSYEQMDAALKPKSAYLAPIPGSGLSRPVAVEAYGDDHYSFKLAAIRDRISLSPGDSLNRRFFSVGHNDDLEEPITSWDQLYVPWSARELLIPFLATGLADKKIGIHINIVQMSENDLATFPASARTSWTPLVTPPDATTKIPYTNQDLSKGKYIGEKPFDRFMAEWGYCLDYIEAQIWGTLTLDDVAAFEFTKEPPTGAFLDALRKRKIEIRDGTRQPARIWNG